MHLFELTPNCSLTPRQAAAFFSGIAAVSLLVAGSFAAAGYWPILPFAGLELAALGAALRLSLRRGRRREYIRIDDREVRVGRSDGGSPMEQALPRQWTRVELLRPAARQWPTRLTLVASGRRVEVGSFLTDHERRGLGLRLAELLGPQATAHRLQDAGAELNIAD